MRLAEDLVEHTERCERCQALQDRIDSYEKKGEWNEAMLLIDKQIECFEAEQRDWEYIAEEQKRDCECQGCVKGWGCENKAQSIADNIRKYGDN